MAKQVRPPHERLRAWRDARELGQKEAADRAARLCAGRKFGQGTWSFIERGERQPTLEQAFALERLTRGTPDEVRAAEWPDAQVFRQAG